MWIDDGARRKFSHLLPALEACIDPICVVDSKGALLYLDLGMKGLLDLKGRDLKRKLLFCDVLKHAGCGQNCEIMAVFKKGRAIRLDEVPVARGAKKLRAQIKAAAIRDEKSAVTAAVITVRDTSGEVVLQGKYHKALEVLFDRDELIKDLQERIESLQASARRARNSSG